jgi:hypothetical protein
MQFLQFSDVTSARFRVTAAVQEWLDERFGPGWAKVLVQRAYGVAYPCYGKVYVGKRDRQCVGCPTPRDPWKLKAMSLVPVGLRLGLLKHAWYLRSQWLINITVNCIPSITFIAGNV